MSSDCYTENSQCERSRWTVPWHVTKASCKLSFDLRLPHSERLFNMLQLLDTIRGNVGQV